MEVNSLITPQSEFEAINSLSDVDEPSPRTVHVRSESLHSPKLNNNLNNAASKKLDCVLPSANGPEGEEVIWEAVEGWISPVYWKITDTYIQKEQLEVACLVCCSYNTNTTMLSSIRDIKLKQSFWGRLFGDSGRIELYTISGGAVNAVEGNNSVEGSTHPQLVIETNDARKLYRLLQVQLSRTVRDNFFKNNNLV